MYDDDKQKKRQIKRRNHIQKDLRDLRGPFSPKVMPNKKTEPYKRVTKKDYNIDNEDE